MALLQIENLVVEFATASGPFRAVDGVSLSVEQREVLAIVGESGSGKSVSMLAVMGLLPWTAKVTADRMVFAGTDLLKLNDAERRKMVGKDMAMIFQEPMASLNPCFTVGFQIEEVLRVHMRMDRTRRRARAMELLRQVGIPDPEQRLSSFPHQMSGGQCQRVMIAIAIACNPKLLIADEPTTALDVTVQAGVLDLFHELRSTHDMGVIIITHDMGVVAETANDILVMYAGQIVEHASALDLFDRPEHPYTEALLAALPQLEGEGVREGRLLSIPGRPPDLLAPPPGCRFAPRCAYTGQDECATVQPELREIRPGHWVRSHHPASERAAETVGVT